MCRWMMSKNVIHSPQAFKSIVLQLKENKHQLMLGQMIKCSPLKEGHSFEKSGVTNQKSPNQYQKTPLPWCQCTLMTFSVNFQFYSSWTETWALPSAEPQLPSAALSNCHLTQLPPSDSQADCPRPEFLTTASRPPHLWEPLFLDRGRGAI